MTIYYICRTADLTDIELSQTEEERLACEIVSAAYMYEERVIDLLAIEADSENGTYAQLKGAALCTTELTAENIQIWQTEGDKIYEYLLGPAEDNSRLWSAFGLLCAEMDDFEAICEASNHFNDLAKGFSDCISSELDENIREEQRAFSGILKDLYAIEETKTVTS